MTYSSVTLGNLSLQAPQYGANAKAVPRSGRKPRYIRITDIDSEGNLNPAAVAADLEDPSPYLLREGDLLLARSGNTVGKSYVHPGDQDPAVFAGYLIRFRIDPAKATPRFVFHFTKSERYHNWVRGKKRAAGQPNINATEYSSLEIPLPLLPEQHRIVEILDQADALRQQRRQADEISRKILPALFQEMFGDLPLSAKPLGEQLDFLTSGSRGWAAHYADSGSLFVRIQNVKDLILSLEDVAYVSPPTTKEAQRTKVEPRDVLLSITADLGRTCVVPNNVGDAYINQHLAILRTSNLNPYFLAAYLACPAGLDQLARLNRSAVKAGLNFNDIRSVRLPNAPRELQDCFEKRLNKLQPVQRAAASSATTLETLSQTLLHRAFDGSLTAKWREAHAKELLEEMEHQAR